MIVDVEYQVDSMVVVSWTVMVSLLEPAEYPTVEPCKAAFNVVVPPQVPS